MRRIAICDDEIGTCSDLEKMILDFADRRALQIETEGFYSGETFYRSIQEQCPYDLVFLDIQLLEMDGVQVRPMDFLIKPITKEKVFCRLYLDEINSSFLMINENRIG